MVGVPVRLIVSAPVAAIRLPPGTANNGLLPPLPLGAPLRFAEVIAPLWNVKPLFRVSVTPLAPARVPPLPIVTVFAPVGAILAPLPVAEPLEPLATRSVPLLTVVPPA